MNSSDQSGKQTVEVFETSTGKRVFQQAAWSPQMLADGKTLVTVKNRDVQLWDTEIWKLKRSIEFKLGRHWDTGDELAPNPAAIPGKSMVVVPDYYPTFTAPYMRWLGEKLRLNAFGSHQVTFIDGTSGRRQPVVLHGDSFLKRCLLT